MHLVDTLETDDKGELGLFGDVEVAVGLGLALEADFFPFLGSVFLDVRLGALEDDGALLLGGLLAREEKEQGEEG